MDAFGAGSVVRWLVDEPLPPRGRTGGEPQLRGGTANVSMGTVGEFLSWSALQGLAPATVVSQLVEPKFLRYNRRFDAGEDGQHRTIQARRLTYQAALRCRGMCACRMRRSGT